jgi:hypothetical protein
MTTKIYHGNLDVTDVAQAIANFFHRGPLMTKVSTNGNKAMVQISTHNQRLSGGATSLGIGLSQVGDRLEVRVGDQSMLGVLGSLGKSAFLAIRNPLNLLGRIDDIAQDIEHFELDDQVWKVIDQLAQDAGASHNLTERLARLACEYCKTANPVGEGRCIACGAPLGGVQPHTCGNCGYAVNRKDRNCPNCDVQVAVSK